VTTRHILCLALALAYGAWRLSPHIERATPNPTPSVAVPFDSIGKLSSQLNSDDKTALRSAYLILSRSVAADPATDPAFPDTAAVRRAHRAALLFVWKGVLDNKTGEVPGLKDALESAVNARIGTAEIPMNPQLKAETSKAFADIAASIK
jgi:hypothetical protein